MNDLSALTLAPADLFRRAAAWLIDVFIVALLFLIPFAASMPRIEGCTWDPEALTFPDECVFETSRMVEREDGTTEQVYVFDDGEEIAASTPTLQTALFGEFIIKDAPGPAAYLIPFAYILAVWVGIQGLLGFTPGKAIMGLRLANEEGRAPGVVPALIRWLVIDGGIGLLGLLVALVNGPTFVRFLAANSALGLVGGIYALVTSGRRTGDHAAHTLVIDETLFRRPERPERPEVDESTEYAQPELAAHGRDASSGTGTGAPAGATAGAAAYGATVFDEVADEDHSPRLTPRRRADQPDPVPSDAGRSSSTATSAEPGALHADPEPGWQPQPAPPWPPAPTPLTDLPDVPAPSDLPQWAAESPVDVAHPAFSDPTPDAASATSATSAFSAPPNFPDPPGVGGQPVLGGLATEAPATEAPVTEAPVTEPSGGLAVEPEAAPLPEHPVRVEPDPVDPTDTPSATPAATVATTASEPQWNDEREAWMMWDNDRQEWLQYDEEIGAWLHYDATRAVWVALQE